jgi:2-haloacid dehalogenase
MTQPYSWLLFDADDTLFDYRQAETSALQKSLAHYGLDYQPAYLTAYQKFNQDLWKQLEQGLVTQDVLRVRRFEQLFSTFQLSCPAEAFSLTYLDNLAESSQLTESAEMVVRTLRPRYRIAILTNGLKQVQRRRFAISTLRDCIDAIVISEEVGSAKPHPEYYDAAFAAMGNPPRAEALMIGDSLTSDIQGGIGYGIDTCWFNPHGLPRPAGLQITYEIHSLPELLPLLA